MLDVKAHHTLQRSFGEADLSLCASGQSLFQICQLRQLGCAKVFLPKGATPEAVFLNTAGGLTGGDRLAFSLKLGAGLNFTASTQTAERAYASTGEAALVKVRISAAPGAQISWLPQETILYENSHLRRRTDISLASAASALSCEMFVLGRHAMDEHPKNLTLDDQRRFFIGDRLVWSESVQIGPENLARQQGSAVLSDARCFATVVMIGQGVEGAASALQPFLGQDGCDATVSAWGGKLILRARARHSWPMRKQIAAILTQLRGTSMPRVWQMNGDII